MPEELSFNNITEELVCLPGNTLNKKKLKLSILRLDNIHPYISGNKWFKLRYYIEEAIQSGQKHIVTFGGAWSNHIVATAAVCRMRGLTCTGIIRGEMPVQLSSTLLLAREMGMQLQFVPREEYRQKKIPAALLQEDSYVIDEGGYGKTGAKGASTILGVLQKSYSHYCCAVGTGTMLAGLINAAKPGQQVTGISVLKNNTGLTGEVDALIENKELQWQLLHDYHFGGYAKHTPALIRFMNQFYEDTKIPSDFVYTGKLFFAVTDLIHKDHFPPGSTILMIHSGGLQGNDSLDKGTLIF